MNNEISPYQYNAVNKLPFLTESFNGNITKIVIYDIFHTNSLPPFLRFLLEKNILGELDFIYPKEPFTSNNVVNFLKTFFEKYNIPFTSDVFQFEGAINLFSKGNDSYLFIDISDLRLETNYLSLSMVLIDEIINIRQIYNIKISESVTNFFLKNNDFIFLQDEKEKNIEIPTVVYVGKPEKTLEFTFIFGNIKSLEKNYYYFTNYDNALQEINDMKLQSKKGIVRFAIFTGKMFVPNETNTNNNNFEDWTNNYNSIYLEQNKSFIIKDYSQQIPLSYHYF
jgi:hypothetical protein